MENIPRVVAQTDPPSQGVNFSDLALVHWRFTQRTLERVTLFSGVRKRPGAFSQARRIAATVARVRPDGLMKKASRGQP